MAHLINEKKKPNPERLKDWPKHAGEVKSDNRIKQIWA